MQLGADASQYLSLIHSLSCGFGGELGCIPEQLAAASGLILRHKQPL